MAHSERFEYSRVILGKCPNTQRRPCATSTSDLTLRVETEDSMPEEHPHAIESQEQPWGRLVGLGFVLESSF